MEKKFEDILKKAHQLFRNYGVKTISMDDVSKHAGVSKKTLYKYVDNKEDLILKVVDLERDQIRAKFQSIPDSDSNAIDILMKYSEIVNSMYEDINPAFLRDIKKYYQNIENACLDATNSTIANAIRTNIELGIKQGLYRDDLDIETTTYLYAQKIQNVHRSDEIEGFEFSSDRLFKVMIENHVMGISNEKGRAYFEEKMKQLNIK